jgi:hypothetical protein
MVPEWRRCFLVSAITGKKSEAFQPLLLTATRSLFLEPLCNLRALDGMAAKDALPKSHNPQIFSGVAVIRKATNFGA